MTEKFVGIVLDVTRHSDRHNIVTLFTRSRGRVSFISPAGGGKSGRIRHARLQPLAVIEGDMNFRQNAELQRLGAFSLHTVWGDIYFNPVKQMLALFLSEFLNKLMRASMPDENTWDYVFNAIRLLDSMKSGVADFHIVFLSSLLPFAGIQPDAKEYTPGDYLDMQSGNFTPTRPPHRDFLQGEEAQFAARLCRINFSNFRILRLNSNLRLSTLQKLLHYYGLHFPGCANLKSLSVIHDVFH